jgi:hypothetical protein
MLTMVWMRDSPAVGCIRANSARNNVLLGLAVLASFLTFNVVHTVAQTGGQGAITGTVQDSTGAVVPNATVIAHNNETGIDVTRTSSSAGVYEISPLNVGTYSVKASASGFQTFQQQNIVINQGQTFGLNVTLKVGNAAETVTVTSAPPQLDTADATLGGTLSSSEFLNLPLMVSGNQQRDITSFSNLLPGAQAGSRSSLFSGTANRVQEVYLDGIPLTTISQIGDNRPIFNLVPAEGIGQLGATTSGASVEYQGAGSVNYTLKSGGNSYHGSVADFVRNTIFDTWGFSAPAATVAQVVNGVITQVPAGKPIDHQNELSVSGGGPIIIPHVFNGRDKLFFFAAYDRVHTRSAPAYSTVTVPTSLMRQGNFTQIPYPIYDPTKATCTGNVCTRAQFDGMFNGVATPNVIPASEISPIAKTMESFLPPATDDTRIQNNYIGGNPSGYDNWLYSARIDYTVSPKQTIAAVVTGGNRKAYPWTSNALSSVPSTDFPIPYIGTTYTTVAGHWADFSDTYTFTPHVVNQFKYGFSNFGGPPAINVTQGLTQYNAVTMGINFPGAPANGQALTEFPTSAFAGSNEPNQWGGGSVGQSNTTVSQTYTAVDNLLWVKGKHAMTFGMQFQWLEDQQSTYDGPTSTVTFNYSPNDTAQENGTSFASGTGYSYASYLLGAVNATSLTVQPFSVLGGRYRPIAPYFEDNYKVTPKLTLNLGLRWDYIPTYQETLARYSFLNPTLTNPVTQTPGALQFAGNWGGPGASCGCASPASNYMKNWGPRFGFAYQVDDKTVFRGAFSTVYSHGGGTGGAGGAATGPSQNGFNVTDNFPANNSAGPGAGPVFYLNNSGYGPLLNNSTFGGPGHVVPSITPPSAASLSFNTGNTVGSTGAFVVAGGAAGYADPYLSGRAPEFQFWNFGMERQFTQDLTVSLNYAGSESHFIAGAANMRGLQSGQINPIYYALGTTLTLPATSANLATANTKAAAAGLPAITLPYAGFGMAANTSAGAGQATIYRALTWMPQYSSTTDTWGSQSANSVYHSFQLSVTKRTSHGLTLNLNYTYSHNIDDAGTQRSGWALPGSVLLSGQSWKPNRIDRSTSLNSVPENLTAYGVYELPFGKDKLGGSNMLARTLAGGWQLSGIFTYATGTPLAITSSACSTSFQPTAGTCMPDLNPNFTGQSIRQNGSWGAGTTAKTLGTIRYINGYIASTSYVGTQGADSTGAACGTNASSPFCNPGQFHIGDAPRTGAFGLRNPGVYNLNMSVRRTFNIIPERVKFVFGVDCQNVTNKVTFSGIGASINSSSFGTVTAATSNTGSRDFQFSGRLNF